MSVGLTIHASRNKCFARRSGDPAPYGPHGRRESTRSARRPTHSSRLTPHASRNKSFAQRTRSARRPTHNSQLTIHNSYFDSAQHKQLSQLTAQAPPPLAQKQYPPESPSLSTGPDLPATPV